MEIPIPTLHLFPKLDKLLIELLKSLSPPDWNKVTLAKLWTVKDVAAHLLDGNLRSTSILRDGYTGDPAGPIKSYQELVAYLNRLNADWVRAFKRISPEVLIELLEKSGKAYHQSLESLDPFSPSPFPVDWAGERESQNWFHIAREYTEKWHHQQQIREATGKDAIMTREFFFPVMDTFMRALPHQFRDTKATVNSLIVVHVMGETGGTWRLLRKDDRWVLTSNTNISPAVEVSLDPNTAWQLFTRALDRQAAAKSIVIEGNAALAEPVLEMIAVMA